MASNVEAEHEPVFREMSKFFSSPNGGVRTAKFSESEVQKVTELLSHSTSKWDASWSKVPRLYCILRLIGLESAMDQVIGEGITSDTWFPFKKRNLPTCLGPEEKEKFVAIQHMVETEALYLEKGLENETECRHIHFRSNVEVPLIRLSRLGTGGFGTVDKVQSKASHKIYARKQTPRSWIYLKSKREIEAFERERDAMMKLSHRHCVEFIGSYTTPTTLGLLVSPVAEMDLEKFLSESQATYPGRNLLLREFFGCLSRGFRYLHEEANIRHRDIKPANILIYEGMVKISDFGLSLDWTGTNTTTTASSCPGWSPRYCAPEVANSLPRSSSSDIWSLGCVFLEMVTVLKGETVTNLLDFIRSYQKNGIEIKDGSALYHSNPEAIAAWTWRLKTLRGEDDEPIIWVNEMLDLDKSKRPYAAKLVQYTCHEGRDRNWKYCGICCADGSDDEGDTGDSLASSSSHEHEATSTPLIPAFPSETNHLWESGRGTARQEPQSTLVERASDTPALHKVAKAAIDQVDQAESGHQKDTPYMPILFQVAGFFIRITAKFILNDPKDT